MRLTNELKRKICRECDAQANEKLEKLQEKLLVEQGVYKDIFLTAIEKLSEDKNYPAFFANSIISAICPYDFDKEGVSNTLAQSRNFSFNREYIKQAEEIRKNKELLKEKIFINICYASDAKELSEILEKFNIDF